MHSITITSVFKTLADLGVVESQREFSRYLGRGSSWFSSALAHDRQEFSTESLLLICRKLDESISMGFEGASDDSEPEEDRIAYRKGAEELVGLKASIENLIDQRINAILN